MKSSFFCATVVMIVLPIGLLAQTLRIDSLQSILPQVHESKRAVVLLQLSSDYIDVGCYRRAIEVATAAEKLSEMFHDSLSLIKSVRYKAMAFREINQLDSSLKLLKYILPIAKRFRDVEEIKFILNGLGITSAFKASYDEALVYYFQILELPLNSRGVTEQVVLTNIGAVFYKLKEYLTALNYFHRAKQLGNPGNQVIEINLILCYAHLGRLSEANKYIEEIDVSFKGRLSAEMEMHFFFARGIVAMFKNDLKTAKVFFLKSLALSKMQGDDRISLDNLISLSKLDIDQGLFHLAEHYLQQAKEIIREESTYNLELIQVYAQLSLVSSKMSDFKKMAYYQSKYIQLKDSVYNEVTTTNLMKINAEHLEKENRAKIEFQDTLLELNKIVIKNQQIANAAIGCVAILLVVLAIILVKNNVKNRRANRLLDERVQQRTAELEMNQNALQRALHERAIVAHRASSDIKSSVATVKGLCLLGLKDIDHPKAREYFHKIDYTSERLFNVLESIGKSFNVDNKV